MKNVVLIIVTLLFAGCSNVDVDNIDPSKSVDFELSHRMIFLRESSHAYLHGVSAHSLPYKDTIKIESGNGIYSIKKVKTAQVPSGLITDIKTEVTILGDNLMLVSISGPTEEEYKINDKLIPACEDIYLLTDTEGKKISFGIRDTYRVDMPDISEGVRVDETFLKQLDSYCQ